MYTIPVWNVGIRIRYLFSSLDDAAFAQDNESAIDWPNRMIYHLLFSFCCFALVELSSLDPSHEKLCCLSLSFPSRLLFSDANTDKVGHMNNIYISSLLAWLYFAAAAFLPVVRAHHQSRASRSQRNWSAIQRINHGERTVLGLAVATKSNLILQHWVWVLSPKNVEANKDALSCPTTRT